MKCQDCGVKSDDVQKTDDPYESDVNGKTVNIKVCRACLRERSDAV